MAEEYPLIDRDSRELLGYLNQFPDREALVLYREEVERERKADLQEAVQFLRDETHPDLDSLAQALAQQRAQVIACLHAHGCRIAVAGTCPNGKPEQQTRLFSWYRELVGNADIIARRLQIFATTFYVDIGDPDLAVRVMNDVRYILPHILALSTSSPFWDGSVTGLKSYRQVLRDALLRTDLPPYFESTRDYQDYMDTLIQTNCIKSPADVRWDVCLDASGLGLVFSVCDAITLLPDVITIAAILQSIVAWMADLRLRNMHFRIYSRQLIMENKWRSLRYGTEGRLIDFGKEQEIPLDRLTWELGHLLEPYADALGTLRHIERAFEIVDQGSSADRQLAVWQESGQDMARVIDFIADTSEEALA